MKKTLVLVFALPVVLLNVISICVYSQPSGACCEKGPDKKITCKENVTKTACQNDLHTFREWFQDLTCAQAKCENAFREIPANSLMVPNSSFKATYSEAEKQVTITWKNPLQNESPNFFISRSDEGSKFKVIGILYVSANGMSNEFVDNYPLLEGYYRVHYYINGRAHASQTLAVFAVAKDKLHVLPNPTTGKLRILLADMQTFDTDVTVYDVTGRIMLSKKINKGSHPEIDLSSLSNGTFIVQAKQNGMTYAQKIQKN